VDYLSGLFLLLKLLPRSLKTYQAQIQSTKLNNLRKNEADTNRNHCRNFKAFWFTQHTAPPHPPPLLKTSTHNTCSITLLIRTLANRTASCPERIGPSGQHFLAVTVLHIFVAYSIPPSCQIHIRNYMLILCLFVIKRPA